ncbi:MAG: hypothetical protein WBQ36_13100 [Desulfobaccales bacterium]
MATSSRRTAAAAASGKLKVGSKRAKFWYFSLFAFSCAYFLVAFCLLPKPAVAV